MCHGVAASCCVGRLAVESVITPAAEHSVLHKSYSPARFVGADGALLPTVPAWIKGACGAGETSGASWEELAAHAGQVQAEFYRDWGAKRNLSDGM